MGTKLQNWLSYSFFALLPLFAQAGKEPPKKVSASEVQATYREGSWLSDFLGSIDWWMWVLLVLLFVLIGVFIYLRKHQEDDDD